MHRPWLAPFIILFWCLTTSWLVVAKILPSLLPGSPPGYQALYASNNRLIPVAWTVRWQDRPLGSAVSESRRSADGNVTVETLLRIDNLPLHDLLPAWTVPIIGRAISPGTEVQFEARGRLMIDPQGSLRAFRSTVDLPGGGHQVLLNGTVDDGHVKIEVRAGDMSYETSRFLPSNIMIGDELSPQATMPGLALGKRWTVPVYNPLRGGKGAFEVLHAEVVSEETLFCDDRLVRVDLVVYRDDPSDHHEPCARIWVARSGRVLKQESTLFGSTLTFLRCPDGEAERLAGSLRTEQADSSPDTP